MAKKEFTGRKMAVLTVSAFAVIIAVNLVLAYKAVQTFPGLETPNSYVASQNFDRERAAQLALGWTVRAEYTGDRLLVSITDREGMPVEVKSLGGIVGRTTMARDDQSPEFTFNGHVYSAPLKLKPGYWHFALKAVAQDGTKFHQRLTLKVPSEG